MVSLMDMILVKIFATALALSEVTTQPQAVKTYFHPVQDRAQVVQILRDGCAHMRKAFDIESINLDELISTALNDPKAVSADIKAFHGINFADLNTAYHQFCKNESVANPVVVVETDEQLGQSGSLRCQWLLRSNRNETTIVVSHADEIPPYPEKYVSLHGKTAALSRLATYNKGSVEHLFALIDLCLLIERHNNWILARENR